MRFMACTLKKQVQWYAKNKKIICYRRHEFIAMADFCGIIVTMGEMVVEFLNFSPSRVCVRYC